VGTVSTQNPAITPPALRRRKTHAKKVVDRWAPKTNASAWVVAFSLLLISGTIALYIPVRHHDFITYDDYQYVLNNPNVVAGLHWQTAKWALTATEQANWHPLTWLSHALDCQLFGLDAGYHHLVNVGIHALNVLLLFLLLWRASAAVGRSFVVAALFAWHPFNVQSVAWVAERKNLLTTLFSLLAVAAYGWYARRPRPARLAVVAGMFVLALASKPMAVTLPLVLLLLDYWPLQRVAGWQEGSPRLLIPQQPVRRLLLEKLPLFILSAASCVVTVWAQRADGALESLQEFSFTMRWQNSLYSYLMYLWKTFWPTGFSAFYPYPGPSLPLWKPALAVLILSAVSFMVWRQHAARSYLLVGWLWFLGTLVPVIGIVQVGDQAMADRYAYLPLVGIFVMVVWAVAEFFDSRRVGAAPRWALAIIVLPVLSFVTFRQIGYWKDTQTVWAHALTVTDGDLQVEKKFGNALVLLGDPEQAMPHLLNAAKMEPEDGVVDANLGMCLLSKGRTQEAIQKFERAIRLTDGDTSPEYQDFRSSALLDLGIAYTVSGDYSKALTSFEQAKQVNPAGLDDAMQKIKGSIAATPSEADFLTFSLLLRVKGQDAEAFSVLKEATKANPGYANAQRLLNEFETDSR
jgi:Tfp pilus assembly protein PilF